MLICNGIEEQYSRLLEADGCQVVSGVCGKGVDALYGYRVGRIKPTSREETPSLDKIRLHTANLVEWTRELFTRLGWQIGQPDTYPIDLSPFRKCPVCERQIRVAVCCGAHAYWVEEEIREFKRVTAGLYHASVYVQQVLPGIESTCRYFEIELLDPATFTACIEGEYQWGDLPPLRGKVSGHERLNRG